MEVVVDPLRMLLFFYAAAGCAALLVLQKQRAEKRWIERWMCNVLVV
jgi:hypothetical protein